MPRSSCLGTEGCPHRREGEAPSETQYRGLLGIFISNALRRASSGAWRARCSSGRWEHPAPGSRETSRDGTDATNGDAVGEALFDRSGASAGRAAEGVTCRKTAVMLRAKGHAIYRPQNDLRSEPVAVTRLHRRKQWSSCFHRGRAHKHREDRVHTADAGRGWHSDDDLCCDASTSCKARQVNFVTTNGWRRDDLPVADGDRKWPRPVAAPTGHYLDSSAIISSIALQVA
jgi:hypothetical protein